MVRIVHFRKFHANKVFLECYVRTVHLNYYPKQNTLHEKSLFFAVLIFITRCQTGHWQIGIIDPQQPLKPNFKTFRIFNKAASDLLKQNCWSVFPLEGEGMFV